MLGSSALFIPGILVLALGLTLQAGATGAVKAIKMSAQPMARATAPSHVTVSAGPQPGVRRP